MVLPEGGLAGQPAWSPPRVVVQLLELPSAGGEPGRRPALVSRLRGRDEDLGLLWLPGGEGVCRLAATAHRRAHRCKNGRLSQKIAGLQGGIVRFGALSACTELRQHQPGGPSGPCAMDLNSLTIFRNVAM